MCTHLGVWVVPLRRECCRVGVLSEVGQAGGALALPRRVDESKAECGLATSSAAIQNGMWTVWTSVLQVLKKGDFLCAM